MFTLCNINKVITVALPVGFSYTLPKYLRTAENFMGTPKQRKRQKLSRYAKTKKKGKHFLDTPKQQKRQTLPRHARTKKSYNTGLCAITKEHYC